MVHVWLGLHEDIMEPLQGVLKNRATYELKDLNNEMKKNVYEYELSKYF